MSKVHLAARFVPELRTGITQQQVEKPTELLKEQACTRLYRPADTMKKIMHEHSNEVVFLCFCQA